MSACGTCDRYRQQYQVPLRIAPPAMLSGFRGQCDACFNAKIAACNSYKADMEKHAGPDPVLNFSTQQINTNWRRCLMTADPAYKSRAMLDAAIKRQTAQRLQTNINVLNSFPGFPGAPRGAGFFSNHVRPTRAEHSLSWARTHHQMRPPIKTYHERHPFHSAFRPRAQTQMRSDSFRSAFRRHAQTQSPQKR